MEVGDFDKDRQYVGKNHYYSLEFQYNSAPISAVRRLVKRFTDRQFLLYVNNKLDDYCSKKTVDYVKTLDEINHYDVIWVEYVFFSRILESFGNEKLKVLDTHDRFADRYKLYMKDQKPYRWYSVSEQDETKGLMRSDVIIAIQAEEGKVFERMVDGQKTVSVIGHHVVLKKLPLSHQRKMLFLASGNILNIRTIQYFVEKIFPMVRQSINDAELIIAGSVSHHIQFEEAGIKTIGLVDELESAYAMADIVINPIESGTGLKIKCVEALAFHRALVTSSNGATGLDSDYNSNFIIADEPEVFAREIIHLMIDEAYLKGVADSGYAYVQGFNDAISKEIDNVLSLGKRACNT